MNASSPYIITVFVFASIAIFSNIIVLCFFFRFYKISTFSTSLIFWIHASTLGQMISTLPIIYSGNWFICDFMAFFHYYWGLINVGITVLLTLTYYNIIKGENTLKYMNSHNIHRYGIPFIFLFSLICLLPNITDSYSSINGWCTLNVGNPANIWAICIFYIWIVIALFFCIGLFLYIIYHTFQLNINDNSRNSNHNHHSIRYTLFRSVGLYLLITLICLIPRIIPRFIVVVEGLTETDDNPDNNDNDSASNTIISQFLVELPLYLAGIGYSIVFRINRQLIKLYEDFHHREISTEMNSLQITLQDFDQMLMIRGSNDSSLTSSVTVNPVLRDVSSYAVNNLSIPTNVSITTVVHGTSAGSASVYSNSVSHNSGKSSSTIAKSVIDGNKSSKEEDIDL